MRALSARPKLIVVDPRLTFLASRAELWLQIRPGTDTALALAMANTIVDEKLYDRAFVEKYTHGWDSFVGRLREYPPEKVEEITWVPAAKIREAARLYASTKPACIQWGVAIEQTVNSTDNNRILTDLMAITENLDVPGGNVFFVPPRVRPIGEFAGHRLLDERQRAKRLGGSIFKLADRIAIVTPKLAWDAILTKKPYPLKALLLHGTNPVITRANGKEVYAALKWIDFLTVADFFLTPTAELADIVLPAATWLEFDDIGGYVFLHGHVYARPAIAKVGECWSDHRMFAELGKRLGQQAYWRDHDGDLDHILEPSGFSWQEFDRRGSLNGEMEYRKHERRGFSTPSGKVELSSTLMETWGYDPLPDYHEVPESPVSAPDMAQRYPYILITGARSPVFFHSEHRVVPWLREAHPDPLVEIHPEAAKSHGIENGSWVCIETPRGRIRQRAKLTAGIDPGVVAAEHGWWLPEVSTPGHGWDSYNVDLLTDNDPRTYDRAMGATNLRVLMCRICPAEE